MKILHVANGFPPTAIAGAEQYTYLLASNQAKHHNIAVFCREAAPDKPDYSILDEKQEKLDVRRIVNNYHRDSNFESLYRNPKIEQLFRDYVQEVSPDIIHFQHLIGLSGGLPFVARELDIPFLLTLHDYWYICPTLLLLTRELESCSGPHQGADCRQCLGATVQVTNLFQYIPYSTQIRNVLLSKQLQHRLQKWVERIRLPAKSGEATIPDVFARRMRYMQQVLAITPRLLTPSDFCRRIYIEYGVPSASLQALPLGMDLNGWKNRPAHKFSSTLRFGYIGTLGQHKGLGVLLKAFQRLANPDIILNLFGSGPIDDPFVVEIKHLATTDPRIVLHGRYDNNQLPQLLASTDVILIPTLCHETFSIVTREALLAGKAVIASEVGAIPEIITHGVNGLLVPPGDESALTAAMAQLADDRELVEQLAEATKQTYIKSVKEHLLEIEAIYQEVIDNLYE